MLHSGPLNALSKQSRITHLIFNLLRFWFYLARIVFSNVANRMDQGSLILSCTPKSGSSSLEFYVSEKVGLPFYTPLAGVYADFYDSAAYNYELWRFDIWVLTTFSCCTKTHCRVPARLCENKFFKGRVFAVSRNPDDSFESLMRHVQRTPRHHFNQLSETSQR